MFVSGRKYANPTEHDKRYAQFKIIQAVVNKHNAEFAEGKHTHTLALNEFSDWVKKRIRIAHCFLLNKIHIWYDSPVFRRKPRNKPV